jgi:hypothetical protein
MGFSLLIASTDSGTSMPIESAEESIPSMKLTMLSAAPRLERQARLRRRRRLVPAPARIDAGTASQLIASVRQTSRVRE